MVWYYQNKLLFTIISKKFSKLNFVWQGLYCLTKKYLIWKCRLSPVAWFSGQFPVGECFMFLEFKLCVRLHISCVIPQYLGSAEVVKIRQTFIKYGWQQSSPSEAFLPCWFAWSWMHGHGYGEVFLYSSFLAWFIFHIPGSKAWISWLQVSLHVSSL